MINLPSCFRFSALPSFKRAFFISALFVLAVTFISISASFAADPDSGQPPAPGAEEAWSPDVLVLVMRSMSTGTSNQIVLDQVSINYNGQVSKDEAKNDLYALNAASGWEVKNGTVSTKAGSAPGSVPTTSASFYTQPIIDYRTGRMPVEPFITAFKRFKRIGVIFIGQDIPLNGPKDFENEFVKLDLTQARGMISYQATVKNSNFTKLNFMPEPSEQKAQSTGKPIATRILMAFGLAAVAAVIVFVAAAKLSKDRKITEEERRNGS